MGEHRLQMFHCVRQRRRELAGWSWLAAAEATADDIQPPAQSLEQVIDRFQRKRQAQGFGAGFDGLAIEQLNQQRPQQRRGHSVAGKSLSQKNREGSTATNALPAIGTEHPLPPQHLP